MLEIRRPRGTPKPIPIFAEEVRPEDAVAVAGPGLEVDVGRDGSVLADIIGEVEGEVEIKTGDRELVDDVVESLAALSVAPLSTVRTTVGAATETGETV